jgi:hypothetical protein
VTSERPDFVDPGSTKHVADRLRRTPDFGPPGYLPPRAARRARKIMLREPLGLQWAAAAVIAGLLVLIAGGVLVLRMFGPPAAPFVTAGQVSAVDPGGAKVVPTSTGTEVLVVRAAGGLTVFATPDRSVAWCAASGRLESPDGAVWEPDGRMVGGRGESLARLPAEVHDGVIYVDPTAQGQRWPPQSRSVTPTC